jgi:MYXO-CTERM domain-containing protein
MWWLLASSVAFGVPPDGTPAKLDVGAGKIERLVLSDDGSLLAGRSRAELDAWFLDVESWQIGRFDPCGEVTGVALIPVDGGQEIWVSCGDGTLRGLVYQDGVLDSVYDDEGNPVVVGLAESLSGVWYYEVDGEGLLYALTVATTTATLHVLDPHAAALPVDANVLPGYPATLPWPNFVEGLVNQGSLFVAHRSHEVSRVPLGTPNPRPIPSTLAISIVVQDIAPSLNGGFYGVDDAGLVAEYITASNQFILLLNGLQTPKAVTASEDVTDSWILVTGEEIKIWELSGGAISNPDPIFEIPDADNNIQDSVARDSYVFGGGEGGNIHVTTARPWVYPTQIIATPDSGTSGDTVSVSFLANEPGEWVLYRGGDRTGSGVPVASGVTSAVEELVQVDVDIDLSWDEGDNQLYAVYTNSLNLTGHARVSVVVDNPPRPPALTGGNVGFLDRALQLSFDGISDADLDHYDVYVSASPFESAEFPDDAGPEWDGGTRLETPVFVASAGGESVDVRIGPLQNYVTYYIAVRATDQGGLVGPLSNVVTGRPRPTFTAADLANEKGGSPCSTGGVGGGWAGLLAVGALAFVRRRRLGAVLGLAACALSLLASPEASAQEKEKWRDQTPQRGNFEVRYGVVNFLPQANGRDNAIDTVYKDAPHNILQVEFGPQIGRVLEFDAGIGLFQELAFRVDLQGSQSADRTMLTWWPLLVSTTGRLHIVDEQFLVPFVRYGLDYVMYSELTDNSAGGKDKLQGAKLGHHYAFGFNLLLDTINRGRASLLEAQTGINDTYLVVEFRRQNVDSRRDPWRAPVKRGFDFTSSMVTVGFKLDY